MTTDARACRVQVIHEGEKRWGQDLPGCGGVLEAVVAMDSVSYIRTATAVAAFDLDGGKRWSALLEPGTLPATLLAPTVLADSRVALAVTPRKVTVYERDGSLAWGFAVPSSEAFAAAPAGMKTEGLVVSTSHATYLLSAAGEVRWRAPR
jgi:hypothetical protein